MTGPLLPGGGAWEFQGSFYAANWLILANFDPNFVIPEISVNQVRKYLACMLGGSGRIFLTACLPPICFARVHFSQIFALPEWSLNFGREFSKKLRPPFRDTWKIMPCRVGREIFRARIQWARKIFSIKSHLTPPLAYTKPFIPLHSVTFHGHNSNIKGH